MKLPWISRRAAAEQLARELQRRAAELQRQTAAITAAADARVLAVAQERDWLRQRNEQLTDVIIAFKRDGYGMPTKGSIRQAPDVEAGVLERSRADSPRPSSTMRSATCIAKTGIATPTPNARRVACATKPSPRTRPEADGDARTGAKALAAEAADRRARRARADEPQIAQELSRHLGKPMTVNTVRSHIRAMAYIFDDPPELHAAAADSPLAEAREWSRDRELRRSLTVFVLRPPGLVQVRDVAEAGFR
jgi:hypothetical protein